MSQCLSYVYSCSWRGSAYRSIDRQRQRQRQPLLHVISVHTPPTPTLPGPQPRTRPPTHPMRALAPRRSAPSSPPPPPWRRLSGTASTTGRLGREERLSARSLEYSYIQHIHGWTMTAQHADTHTHSHKHTHSYLPLPPLAPRPPCLDGLRTVYLKNLLRHAQLLFARPPVLEVVELCALPHVRNLEG